MSCERLLFSLFSLLYCCSTIPRYIFISLLFLFYYFVIYFLVFRLLLISVPFPSVFHFFLRYFMVTLSCMLVYVCFIKCRQSCCSYAFNEFFHSRQYHLASFVNIFHIILLCTHWINWTKIHLNYWTDTEWEKRNCQRKSCVAKKKNGKCVSERETHSIYIHCNIYALLTIRYIDTDFPFKAFCTFSVILCWVAM